MNSCKMCGAPIRPPAAASTPKPATPATRACPSCGGHTPSNYAFCQHCGARLGPAPVPSPAPRAPTPVAGGPVAVAETLAADLGALGGTPRPAPPPAGAFGAPPPRAPSAAEAPPPAGFAPTMAASLEAAAARAPAPAPPPAAPPPMAPPPLAAPPPMVSPLPVGSPARGAPAPSAAGGLAASWRLVSVHRDGRDGAAFPLTSEHTDVGRLEGDITFSQDRFLAARHARLERRGATVWVKPLDRLNGVYLKVVGEHPIGDGDFLLLGKEVFRFELIDKAEREVGPSVQHGTWVFASPPRQPWGRLSQIIVSGAVRDVYHLVRPEIVLGREDGDFRFPDDEFMSRRHAIIGWHEGRANVADLGSSNGTYVRLRGERELKPGDMIRMGDQLFRFEAM